MLPRADESVYRDRVSNPAAYIRIALTNLTAVVIARDSNKENRVTGLDTEEEVTVWFGPGSEVAIIVVDPKLEPPSPAGLAGTLSLWVEPQESRCGELPGTIHEVNASSELLSVIEQADEGDTVLLAPGTYTLPSTALPGGGDYGGNRGALSITKELTLAGAGPDKTELRTDIDGRMWALNNAHTTFRDLKLVSIAGNLPALSVIGVERLTFCKVEFDTPQYWTTKGVSLTADPDVAGFPTLKRVEVVDSAFWGAGAGGSGVVPIGFDIGYGGGDQGAEVTFMVRNSQIADWDYGVFYIDRTETYPHLPDVTLDIDDCAATFSGNRLFNVCERPPQGGLCVEQCPID